MALSNSTRSLKTALLVSAGFAILAAPAFAASGAADPRIQVAQATPAPAPQPAPPAPAAESAGSETVTVTGTRIRQRDYTSNSPIQTISGESLREIGAATVETYLNSLPQFSPSLNRSNNNPQGGGAATVDLRSLGTARGLVLVDGRRLIPGFSGGAVDVSTLPPALVERVEIITGGASAVYGSDAISGVVNFILRKDFQGFQTNAQFGTSQKGDANEFTATATLGGRYGDGLGNGVVSLGYTTRDPLGQGSRFFSANALTCTRPAAGDPQTFIPGNYCFRAGSPTTPDGTIQNIPGLTAPQQAALQAQLNAYFALPANGGAPAGTVVLNNPAVNTLQGFLGFNPDGTLFGTGGVLGNALGQNVVNYRGPFVGGFDPTAYSYNFNPDNQLLLGFERFNMYGRAEYKLADWISAWADILVTSYKANTALAPAPTSIPNVSLATAPADLQNLLIAAGINPATTNVTVVRRFNELGARAGNYDTFSWQISGGFEGEFAGPIEGSTWNWDVTGSFGRYKQEVYFRGYASISRARAAGAGCPAGSPTAINGQACTFANLFGAGNISAAARRYIEYPYFDTQRIQQTNVMANLTGDLFELPAGWVAIAVGAEYRKQSYARVADANLPSGDVGGANAAAPFNGSFSVWEAYGELAIPLVKDVFLIEDLSVEGGYRVSDYDNAAGRTSTYKYGLSYMPTDWLRFRVQQQGAVRAPSLGELFQARNEGFPGVAGIGQDPCAASSPQRLGPDGAAVLALCQAQAPGVNFALFDPPAAAGQYRTFSGGNPNLTPERAKTLTVGAVFQADKDWGAWLGGLTATVDYWKIDLEDGIGTVGAGTIFARCYSSAFNAGLSPAFALCQQVNRDPISGALTSASTGFINVANANLREIKLRGLDLALAYRIGLEEFGLGEGSGVLSVVFQATRFFSYQIVSLPGNPASEFVGTAGDGTPGGGPLPKWKTTANFSYDVGDFEFGWRWVHIGSADAGLTALVSTPVGPREPNSFLSAANYHYANVRWNATEELSFYAGVDNVFDRKPPIYGAGFQYNTDPGTYDVIGRYFYFGVSTRF